MTILNRNEQTYTVDTDQKPHFSRLAKYLWRGGKFAYFTQFVPFENEGKADIKREQTWFEVASGCPIPTRYNTYFGVYPSLISKSTGQRTKIADVASMGGMFAEFDLDKWHGEGELLDAIKAFNPLPTVINFSGGGYHVYWIFKKPHLLTDNNRDDTRDVVHAWVKCWGGDEGAKDLTRILRVPGTYNFKEKYPEPLLVSCIHEDYSLLYDAQELFELARPFIPAKIDPSTTRPISVDHDQKAIKRTIENALNYLLTAPAGTHHMAILHAGKLLGGIVAIGAISRSEAENNLYATAYAMGQVQEDGERKVRTDIQNAVDFGLSLPLRIEDKFQVERYFTEPLPDKLQALLDARVAIPVQPIPGNSPFYHLDTERALIGIWLLYGKDYLSQVWPCKSSDFFLASHQVIVATLERMAMQRKAIDYTSVHRELSVYGFLPLAGGENYLQELVGKRHLVENAPEYAQEVASFAKKRALRDIGLEINATLSSSTEDVTAIHAQVQEKIFRLALDSTPKATTLSAALSTDMDRVLNHLQGVEPDYLHFGNRDVDRLIIGLEPGDLMILAAIPGAGKSALSANWALNWPCLVWSGEMTTPQYTQRLLTIHSAKRPNQPILPFERIRDGRLTVSDKDDAGRPQLNEWKLYGELSNELTSKPIYIDDTPGITISQLFALTRYHVRQYGTRVLIVDHLGLMQPENKKLSREQQVSEISWGLKMIARELGIRVLALSQLNRDLYKRADKRPLLSDLRDSGSLEQNSDIVGFIYRDDMFNENSETPNFAEIIIAKQRNGRTGTASVYYEKSTLTFKDGQKQAIDLTTYGG